MAYGAIIYNAAGTEILNNSDFITKVSGTISINANGSLVVPGVLAGNTVFATFVAGTQSNAYAYPAISISGTTITWFYRGSIKLAGIITYGTF